MANTAVNTLRRTAMRYRFISLSLLFRIPGSSVTFEGPAGFLGFGLTLVFENPGHVLLPVQLRGELPGFGENLRILNGYLILDGVCIRHRVALDKLHCIAMEI